MSCRTVEKLLICFISALDLRRIKAETTPYLTGLLAAYPWVRTKTFPEVDLDPTILTGVYPHEHGMWQVKLNSNSDHRPKQTLADKLPDLVTTTFQCLVHLLTGSFNLAAVPHWRRRRFEITKTRYMQRNVGEFLRFNGRETIFSLIGQSQCNFVYGRRFDELRSLTAKLFSSDYRLTLLEFHALDTLQHWNLDDPVRVEKHYRDLDAFVKELHARCQQNGVAMMFLADHGMEPVRGSINLIGQLEKLRLPRDEYTYFIEVSKARFWFHTDRARKKIVEMLSSLDHGTVLSYRDMHQYNVRFDDDRFGEVYFIADPGYIFFPHDYHHPIGNLFLGLTDWQQRSRLKSPKHRGYHGYLPHHESEKGLMLVLDDRYRAPQREADIIDVAPTILELLGAKKPGGMKGRCVLGSD